MCKLFLESVCTLVRMLWILERRDEEAKHQHQGAVEALRSISGSLSGCLGIYQITVLKSIFCSCTPFSLVELSSCWML